MGNGTIKLFGISGSPRKASTDHIVNEALHYAFLKYHVETEYFSAMGKNINFCIHCDYCIKNKKGCIHKDDMQFVYEKMKWADALIIGTPVYQGMVSGQTKTIMDRCRAIAASDPNFILNKPAAAMAVGGDRIGGQEPSIQAIHNFYVINEAIPVGGGSFGANLGGAFWSQDRGAEGASEDEEGLKSMRKTVNRLMKLVLMMKKNEL
ncbi:MAG: flavodoxin family protein [Candidatus Methanoperedens sp.]|nr:flavodoxin family protein [Candidatus Methanoperedens sp.]MCE8425013.1 flavodoxin family protein [Candidatus Methanoperedens sp.]MCE8427239.1 flavodoxin family protein [Candidatus Methanoperedens sp.]